MQNLAKVCLDWKERIAAGEEGEALRAHLLVCASCRSWSEQVSMQSRAVSALAHLRAPESLDLRVAQELRNPETLSRRWVKRLCRIPAPSSLWGRVREEISLQKEKNRLDRARWRRWVRWTGAAAACLAVAVGGVLFVQNSGAPRRLPIVVKDVDAPGELSTGASGVLEGAFGFSSAKSKSDTR